MSSAVFAALLAIVLCVAPYPPPASAQLLTVADPTLQDTVHTYSATGNEDDAHGLTAEVRTVVVAVRPAAFSFSSLW